MGAKGTMVESGLAASEAALKKLARQAGGLFSPAMETGCKDFECLTGELGLRVSIQAAPALLSKSLFWRGRLAALR